MKYRQLDRITILEPMVRLVGERTLHAEEEYLKDHFPRFPVMPGVMMLEALQQAANWLISVSNDFSGPLVLLREVRGVKFADFLTPGETLTITAEILKHHEGVYTVKATGAKGDKVTVTARLILEQCSSGDPTRLGSDDEIRYRKREQFTKLYGQAAGIRV
jgi:3-hydroxyacyl-[acyl-carrier-protein] dehydratase